MYYLESAALRAELDSREAAVSKALVITVAKEAPHFYFGTEPVEEAALEVELKKAMEGNPNADYPSAPTPTRRSEKSSR